ncbi:N-acetylmuramoyl-L-alanine amidase [Nonomuraea sp. NPDC049158]|uniref:peptidoglycan recognition protein family protein n=1 Tax=Nonomuraea sp. NPDC049158 TaxID=3155649 RepID=UPI0033CA41B5
MPYLTQLATVARRTGFPVVEVSGWRTRGHGPQPAVRGIVAHHTAGRADMHVVRDGRPGLDGPLSQFWLRHDGTIYVVAAGKCWHNYPSTSPNHDNSHAIGIEAENDGREAWPTIQLDAYKRLCAELCRAFGVAASRVKGHKEVQPGKPDPHHVDMDDFRRDVAQLLLADHDGPSPWPGRLLKYVSGEPLMMGQDVRTWQAALTTNGFKTTVDGAFGEKTRTATRKLQRREDLDDDGVVGPLTWAAAWQ